MCIKIKKCIKILIRHPQNIISDKLTYIPIYRSEINFQDD